MGAVLSPGPGPGGGRRSRASVPDDDDGSPGRPEQGALKARAPPPLLLPARAWKRLVASGKRRGPRGCGGGREAVAQRQRQHSLAAAVPPPLLQLQPQARAGVAASGRRGRLLVQASTAELLRCLGAFLCRRCFRVKRLGAGEAARWLRAVDRALVLQGWQREAFVSPPALVFVYLLCRHGIDGERVASPRQLRAALLTCLYLAYCYLGHEISYPLKPFLVADEEEPEAEGRGGAAAKDAFWQRCLRLVDAMSGRMLRINADPRYFTQVFADLKGEGAAAPAPPAATRPHSPPPPRLLLERCRKVFWKDKGYRWKSGEKKTFRARSTGGASSLTQTSAWASDLQPAPGGVTCT